MQIMTHCVEEAKAQLRRQCLQRRTEMWAEAVTRVSAAIASRVAALDIWPRSGSVHSYVDSMAGEVQTEGLIRIALAQGSQVVVPVVPPGRRRRLLHALITSLEEDLTAWLAVTAREAKADELTVEQLAQTGWTEHFSDVRRQGPLLLLRSAL